MTPRIADPALWLPIPALAASLITVLRHRRAAAARAERIGTLERAVSMREDEARHLVEHRIPALMGCTSEGRRARATAPLHEELAGTAFAQAHDVVLSMFKQAAETSEQTAQGLLLTVARALQGLANSQQLKITDMTLRHDDPDFLDDLMEVDHTNAQILRRSAGIAVVCGSWPGRQHNATPLIDVVRGAIGRILDYRRVQITRIEDSRAVIGRAVEGLVLTLAELLENATRYSNPSTAVQVHVQLTHNGLALIIEDAGIGLNPAERERITRLLRRDTAPDLSEVGNPPHFGLAVCGLLARRYGFTVAVDSASPFGGVRAVVNVPSFLLTDAVTTPARSAGIPAPQSKDDLSRARHATTVGGLPKRTRQAPVTAEPSQEPQPAPAPPARDPRDPREAAAPFSGFLRGTQAARRTHPTSEGTH